MGTTTALDEPQPEAPESFIEPIPQQPYSKELSKESAEPLPVRLLEVLLDIRTAMVRYPAFDTDAQAAEAYQVAQALQEILMKAVETVQEFPAAYRRSLFYIFSTLTLFTHSLQNLITVNQKFQGSSEMGKMLKQEFVQHFQTHAEEYRQWLLKAIVTKET